MSNLDDIRVAYGACRSLPPEKQEIVLKSEAWANVQRANTALLRQNKITFCLMLFLMVPFITLQMIFHWDGIYECGVLIGYLGWSLYWRGAPYPKYIKAHRELLQYALKLGFDRA